MPLERIKALGEKLPAADDAVLFLWVTSPKLVEGLAVLRAWEFEYRTCMVWVKDKIGMGYYARQQHGSRAVVPIPQTCASGTHAYRHRPSSVFHGERGEHSTKPESVYELIEAKMCGYCHD